MPAPDRLTVWIAIAYDPLPGIDRTLRLLRYGTLAETLATRGHRVVLWTSTFDHWRKVQRFDADTTVRLSEFLTIELLFAPAYGRNISFARLRHNRRLASAFARKATASDRPDVIFAGIPCLELAEAAAAYSTDRSVPLVCDIQDIWPEVYVSALPAGLRPFGRLLLATEYARLRRILREARSITAVSLQYLGWAQRRRAAGGTTMDRVFPLGYRMPPAEMLQRASARAPEFLRAHGLESAGTLVTFLGQFGASYDLETVVEAAKRLGAGGGCPGLRVVLAGAGDKTRGIRRAASGHGNITLTGWLDYIDTLTLLGQSHIGLSTYSSRAAQSLPYKPFEYMAFGLPLVNSLRGELSQIIALNRIGSNYNAGSADSLVAAISGIASNPDERAAAGRRARSLFEREYDAELIFPRLAGHLEGIASPSILRVESP